MPIERYPYEEFTKVTWVPGLDGIADMSEPTPTELNDAGNVDLTCFLTKDGLTPGGTTDKVTGGSLCSRVNAQTVGGVTYDASLKGSRDKSSGGDEFWDLGVWGAAGYLVVRRGPYYSGVYANTDKVEVYQVQMGQKVMGASAANAEQTFELPLAVQDADVDAVVTT